VAHASSIEGDVEEEDALAEIRKSFESAMAINGEAVSGRVRGRTTH
jgi:hypothetical protein